MRYIVTRQIIQVIGQIWWPIGATCAQEYQLSGYDIENIGDINDRDSVEDWLSCHSGDFSQILDFRADFTIDGADVVHEWKSEDSEFTFSDCMFPSEDDD